ncbi:hypothetical protein B0H15DRAFT_953267 [Mycena belliarum]|uniref:Uncharacterized protein n=1 Tax=Mycena belliarum TaxID=1033014 RepID=A0AAD6XID2_9AGAR|nr:hypothetical protein B0H15DRAFT_953267 [Mycena belliae]
MGTGAARDVRREGVETTFPRACNTAALHKTRTRLNGQCGAPSPLSTSPPSPLLPSPSPATIDAISMPTSICWRGTQIARYLWPPFANVDAALQGLPPQLRSLHQLAPSIARLFVARIICMDAAAPRARGAPSRTATRASFPAQRWHHRVGGVLSDNSDDDDKRALEESENKGDDSRNATYHMRARTCTEDPTAALDPDGYTAA